MTVVTNATTGATLAAHAEIARGPWGSFKGLMGRAGLAADTGLVLPRTRSVHTHFMRFPIDVIFYDGQDMVVGVASALKPWRFSAYHLRAKGAVELPAGTLQANPTQRGHKLRIDSGKDNA